MLLAHRRAGIVAEAVLVADPPVGPMDDHLRWFS